MELKDYLTILIPLIGAIITVGIPGIISLIKILKQEKAEKENRKAQTDKSVVDVADIQVDISLKLVEELKDQVDDLNGKYDTVTTRLNEADKENDILKRQVIELQRAGRLYQAEIEEIRKARDETAFELHVSNVHISHLLHIINVQAQHIQEYTPVLTPKTRDQIRKEILEADAKTQ